MFLASRIVNFAKQIDRSFPDGLSRGVTSLKAGEVTVGRAQMHYAVTSGSILDTSISFAAIAMS
jgi:hypothetical protein